MHIASAAVKRITGSDSITAEQILMIKYHSYGTMGMFQEWLFGDTPITTTQLAQFLFDHTPDFLQRAFDEYPYSRTEILQKAGNYSSK